MSARVCSSIYTNAGSPKVNASVAHTTAALSTAHLQLALARLDPLVPSMIEALIRDGRSAEAAQLACRLVRPNPEARRLLFAFLTRARFAEAEEVLLNVAQAANQSFDAEVLAASARVLSTPELGSSATTCDALAGMYLRLVDHCPVLGAAFVASLMAESPREFGSEAVLPRVVAGLASRVDPLAQHQELLLEVLHQAEAEPALRYASTTLRERAPARLDALTLPTLVGFALSSSQSRRELARQQLSRAERDVPLDAWISVASADAPSLTALALAALGEASAGVSPDQAIALMRSGQSEVRAFGAQCLSLLPADAFEQEDWVSLLGYPESQNTAAARLASSWPLASIAPHAFAEAWCGLGGDMLREIVALGEQEPTSEQLVAVYERLCDAGRPSEALDALLRRPPAEHDPEFMRSAARGHPALAQATLTALLDDIPASLAWTHFVLDHVADEHLGALAEERLLDDRWPSSLVPYAWVVENLSSFDERGGAFAERFFLRRLTPDMLATQSGSDRSAGLTLFLGLLRSPEVAVRRAAATVLWERHPSRAPFEEGAAIMLHRDYDLAIVRDLVGDTDPEVARRGVDLGLAMDERFSAADILGFLQAPELASKRLAAGLLERRRGSRDRACFAVAALTPLIESSERSLRAMGVALLRGEAEPFDRAEGLAGMLDSAHEDVVNEARTWLLDEVVEPSLLVEVAPQSSLGRFFTRGLLASEGDERLLMRAKRELFAGAETLAPVSFELSLVLSRLCELLTQSDVKEEAEMAATLRARLRAWHGTELLEPFVE